MAYFFDENKFSLPNEFPTPDILETSKLSLQNIIFISKYKYVKQIKILAFGTNSVVWCAIYVIIYHRKIY